MECDLFQPVRDVFTGFNQFSQIIFGFALGLAFSQANLTVGWIFFWIIIWEFCVFILFARSPYYDPFFRVAYNCVFLLSVILGQYLYFGKTTFQNFLYPNSIKTTSSYKNEYIEMVDGYLSRYITEEDKNIKKKKINKVKAFFID
jgi:hypothetical protein